MIISIKNHLKNICRLIVAERKTEMEWELIESDDMFQGGPFVGGFDATEKAFCFSYYDEERNEFWFQLTLAEATAIAEGREVAVEGRPAE